MPNEVQFDLAEAAVIPALAPVQDRHRQDGSQCALGFSDERMGIHCYPKWLPPAQHRNVNEVPE
jgi:hypothetical protein